MSKVFSRAGAVACAVLLTAAPAFAQQTLNFSFGYFILHGEDARVPGDVLVANQSFLAFDFGEFNGPSVGGEWLIPIGRFVEGGAGVSFTRQTVPSVYADFVDSDGSEIFQELRLRRVPMDFTVRLLPLGQTSPVQPYIGVGATAIAWRYSEFGEFVDFDAGRQIFRGEFVASGTQAGLVALGGVRFAGPSASAGFEIKYHRADAPLDSRFAGPRIDLGGWTYQVTGGLRF